MEPWQPLLLLLQIVFTFSSTIYAQFYFWTKKGEKEAWWLMNKRNATIINFWKKKIFRLAFHTGESRKDFWICTIIKEWGRKRVIGVDNSELFPIGGLVRVLFCPRVHANGYFPDKDISFSQKPFAFNEYISRANKQNGLTFGPNEQ